MTHRRITPAKPGFFSLPRPWLWGLVVFGVVTLVGFPLLRPLHCLLYYRLTEAIIVLILALASAAVAAFGPFFSGNLRLNVRGGVGGVCAGLFLCVVVAVVLPRMPEEECTGVLPVTATPAPTYTLIPTIPTDTHKPVPAVPTDTPKPTVPTNTPRPTATVPTSTPSPTVPTRTPTPSWTPTPTEIPPLFFDNFDDGIDPTWETVAGKWVMVDGYVLATELTEYDWGGYAEDEIHLAMLWIGGAEWENCAIEVVASPLLRYNYRGGIVVQGQDEDNFILISIDDSHISIAVMQERVLSDWVLGGEGYGEKGSFTIRVEMRGIYGTVFLDGKQSFSFSDQTFPPGQVGIWTEGTADWSWKFDNFKVTPLP